VRLFEHRACRRAPEKTANPIIRGYGVNGISFEILWHPRETRRLVEKANINLKHQEKPSYSTLSRIIKIAEEAEGSKPPVLG
jgi:hypothetical protein